MTEAYISLLEKLIKIPSPSHHEQEASTFLANWMNQHGFTAEIDSAGNAVGFKGDGPKEVILLGHIDTFPGNLPVYREDNLLYGRGSVDAKGPLCTFASAVAELDVPTGWRITVVGAVEEEAATSKGARHILAQRRKHPPQFCIIGEPSQWNRITLGYKGRLLLQIKLRVPFSHSAGQGVLPAEQGVKLWQAIQAYAADFNAERQGAFNTLNPSLRAINSRDDGAFGEVEMSLGFRLPLGVSPATLETNLRHLLESNMADGELALHFTGDEPAYKGPKSGPLVRSFLKAIRDAGGEPKFVVKTGTSDMNVVGPVWRVPILAYGPGNSSLDHTPQEHIDLRDYERAISVLRSALQGLMGANISD